MTIDQLIIVPISIIAFLVLLTFIVFFHEYGHFSVARLLGIKVDTFSIGFGKPLFQWTDSKGTEWRIASLPFGGYVKFFGDLNAASQPRPELQSAENEDEAPRGPVTTQFPTGNQEALAASLTPEEQKVCFHFKPVWARALVVAAGPMANFVLAIAIFTVMLMLLGRNFVPPVIGQVTPNSAAAKAGFQPGDEILSVNGRQITTFRDLGIFIQLSSGDEVVFQVDRAGETLVLKATPRREIQEDGLGNKVAMGRLGVASATDRIEFQRFGPIAAVQESTAQVWRIISTTIRFIGRLVRGKESVDQLGGPVKMAKYAGQAATLGFSDQVRDDLPFGTRFQISLTMFIQLAAVISVSIGFLNLLPIPVLDGGHLVYYAFEAVTGKPLGPNVQAAGYYIGLVLLVSFMIFVTWNDVAGLLGSVFSSNGS